MKYFTEILGFFLILQMQDFGIVYGHIRECRTPLNSMGKCVSLKYCPEVLLFFQKLAFDQATKYSNILKNICGNQITYDHYPMVCCSRPNFQTGPETDYEIIVVEEEDQTTTIKPFDIGYDIFTTESPPTAESPKIVSDKSTDKLCQSPNKEIGICKPLQNCEDLFEAIRENPNNETIKNYLRSSHGICKSIGTDVCCPIIQKTKKKDNDPMDVSNDAPLYPPTEIEGCGRDHHVYIMKVIGGQESEIGAWPWIALLGYNPYSKNPFRCGGTLITARHVITAAHCILPDLTFVRLGEHDLTIEDDAVHVDVDIAKAIKHERYSKSKMRFDIGMVYLVKNVDFTDMIYPICLPMSNELLKKSFISYTPFAAGWGRISSENRTTSNVLREVQLMVHENNVCRDAFQRVLGTQIRRFNDDNFDDSVICVGDLNGKKDTCKGDSGGPLMVSEDFKNSRLYYLIGITSYGIGCGRQGVPAIYTSTQYFMDWILEKIRST